MAFVDVVATDHGPDMPDERPNRGRFERLAAAYLQRRGFELLEANYRCRFGEADLIAQIVSMLIVGESRALLRHHLNALGTL